MSTVQICLLFTVLSKSLGFVPDGKIYFKDGDLIIGGLFGIHSTFNGRNCTDVQREDGIQAIEAMAYSLDRVNNNVLKSINISLGMLGVDTCESETVSLDNTLELIDMRMNKKSSSISCGLDEKKKNNLIGIIGPASSKLSIPVASILRLFKISQISYQSTSSELSDKRRFKYFKRTVPSDNFQARAVTFLLRNMSLQYISIVYEDSSYGADFKSELEKISENYEYCIGTSIKIPYSQTDGEHNKTIRRLLKYKNTNDKVVVVLILRLQTAKSLFRYVSRSNLTRYFYWIGTDGWIGRYFQDGDITRVANGAIGIQLLTGEIPGFKDYFERLRINGNERNPWWSEYTNGTNSYTESTYDFGILNYIDNAAHAFGYAIWNMYFGKCEGCSSFNISLKSGSDLLDALGKVKFPASNNEEFHFINGSEGPPRYSIMRFTSRNHDNGGRWVVIGNYSGIGNKEKIYFNKQEILHHKPSVCSEPCKPGYAKNIKENTCCWRCTECRANQIASNLGCISCPVGFRSNNARNKCIPISIEYMTFHRPEAIATLTLSSLGIVICFFVILIYIIKRNTPIVKATDLKLSLILISALIISYGSSAAFLAKPSPITCALTRCLLGLSYTLQYAPILTKTVRIYSLFQAKTPEKNKFINSRSSITLTLLLTFFHALGLIFWIIFDRPHTRVQYDDVTGVLICHDVDNFSYIISMSYSVGLLVACVVFAVKTRKIPDGFKETRFISVCSYTTCIIWLAFVSTFFFTHNNIVRVLSLCITLSINSTVCLCVLYLSRVYIIIWKPNLNTRDHVMTRGNETPSRCSITLYTTANKSVGTNYYDEEYGYIRNGLLTTSLSVPNLEVFSTCNQNIECSPCKNGLANSFSMDNLSVFKSLPYNKKRTKKNKIKTKDLPRITVNGVDLKI